MSTIRRWVVQKQGTGHLNGWVKLAPAGSYGPAEDPPKPGEILCPVPTEKAPTR